MCLCLSMSNRCTQGPHFLHTKGLLNVSEVGAVGEALALSSWQHRLSPDITKGPGLDRPACGAHLRVAGGSLGGVSGP